MGSMVVQGLVSCRASYRSIISGMWPRYMLHATAAPCCAAGAHAPFPLISNLSECPVSNHVLGHTQNQARTRGMRPMCRRMIQATSGIFCPSDRFNRRQTPKTRVSY